MKKTPRNFLFALVLIIFAIAAPILILYALGYRYDADNHTLRETATIALEFESQGLKVYFDNIFVAEKKESVIIPGVTRAAHHITLTKNDAVSWDEDVETSPGIVTWLSDIVLYRANLGRSSVTNTTDDVVAAIPSTTQNTFGLVLKYKGSDKNTIEIRDRKTQNVITSIPEKSFFEKVKDLSGLDYENAYFTQNDSWLVVPVTFSDKTKNYIAISTKDGSFYSLEALIPKDTAAYLDFKDQAIYFYLSNGKRKLVDLQKRQVSSETTMLYAFHKSFTTYTLEIDVDEMGATNKGACLLSETLDVIGTKNQLGTISCGDFQVFVSPNSNLVIHDTTSGSTIFLDTRTKSIKYLEGKASRFTFASQAKAGDVVVYTSGSELRAYVSDTLDNILLTRISDPVKGMVVSALGTHVVFLSGDTLTAEEITNTRKPVIVSWQLTRPQSFLLSGSTEETLFAAEAGQEKDSLHVLNEITLYDL